MPTLRELIGNYHSSHQALGHFNISDSNQLEAIAEVARNTHLPIVVGLSEGEREFFPISHARALIDLYRGEGIPLYLNADHTYSLEKAKAAFDSGVDSIVIDGSKLSFEANVALLREGIVLAHTSSKDILVEGELGYIGTSSAVIDAPPPGVAITEGMMTTPQDLKEFVTQTGIDLAAPAVGNIHGIVMHGQPKLSTERIAELAKAVTVPLVLHGGSGSSDEEFSASIKAGIAMIHINTDLRVLYQKTLEESLTTHPSETTPYKFLEPSVEAMKNYITQKVLLFAGKL